MRGGLGETIGCPVMDACMCIEGVKIKGFRDLGEGLMRWEGTGTVRGLWQITQMVGKLAVGEVLWGQHSDCFLHEIVFPSCSN